MKNYMRPKINTKRNRVRCYPQGNEVDTPDVLGARFPPSKLPSIPAAAKIAQRTALTPRTRPGPIGVSAPQVISSPKAPGPSETRGSGWTTGRKSSSIFWSRFTLMADAPVLTLFFDLARTLSTFEMMT